MSNVVRLAKRVPRQARLDNDTSASSSSVLARVDQVQTVTKENVRAAIALLVQSNERTQQIISQIDDEGCRARLSAHAECIRALVEIAAWRAAQL